MGVTVIDQCLSQNGYDPLYTGYDNALSQSFTGTGIALTDVVFKVIKTGSPTGSCYAKLYAHSGTFGSTSVPTGAALATSDAYDVSTVPTSATDITLHFSTPYTCVNGTYYVIAFSNTNTNSTNNIGCYYNTPSAHAGNAAYYDTSWHYVGSYDTYFICKNISGASQTCTGGLTASGALPRAVNVTRIGGLTSSGLAKKALSGRVFSGGLTSSGAVTTLKAFLMTLVGGFTSSGNVVKGIARTLAGGLTPSGSLIKDISKAFGAGLTFGGNLITGIAGKFTQLLTAGLSFSGNVGKITGRTLTASLLSSGLVLKNIRRTLTGGFPSSGVVACGFGFVKILTSGLIFSGNLIGSLSKLLPTIIYRIVGKIRLP
jgi:hypothetical protein